MPFEMILHVACHKSIHLYNNLHLHYKPIVDSKLIVLLLIVDFY